MNCFKKILALVCALALCLLVGCSTGNQDAIIYFEIDENPLTVDPQTASSDSELSIVKNIFEGLLRKDQNGKIVCGLSESFTKNGLTYTFKLKDGLIWDNEEPLTSADFVFALKRALSPETKAPFASRLFCIENAKAVFEGKLQKDKLSVSAPDDKTVMIKLAYEDSEFEETLTTSVAMPCNEKFFNETKGKYGLSNKYIISSGNYRLTKWNKESFGIRLYSNKYYKGDFKAKNAAVFITNDDEKTPIERLRENNVDITFVDASLLNNESEIKTIGYKNTCWFLTLGANFSPDMRKALASLVGSDVYSGSLKNGYTAADSIFPPAVTEGISNEGFTPYNLNLAKQLFKAEIAKLEDKKFPSGAKLYYYNNGAVKPIVTDIVGHWQNNLGAFVNIEEVKDLNYLRSELKAQTLPMAIFSVRANSSNVAEYLQSFGVSYNNEAPAEIQKRILKSNGIIPIAFEETTIAYRTSLSNVTTTLGNGYIDFSFIVKSE